MVLKVSFKWIGSFSCTFVITNFLKKPLLFSLQKEIDKQCVSLEILISYIMTEHENLYSHAFSLMDLLLATKTNIQTHDENKASINPKLSMQALSQHSKKLISIILPLTSSKKNFFWVIECYKKLQHIFLSQLHIYLFQTAALKTLCFILKKLGCTIGQQASDIVIFVLHLTKADDSPNHDHGTQQKSAHIQSICRQAREARRHLVEEILHLIPDGDYSLAMHFFETIICPYLSVYLEWFLRYCDNNAHDEFTQERLTLTAYLLQMLDLILVHTETIYVIHRNLLTTLQQCLNVKMNGRIRKIIALVSKIWMHLLEILPIVALSSDQTTVQEMCQWLAHEIKLRKIDDYICLPIYTTRDPKIGINCTKCTPKDSSNIGNTCDKSRTNKELAPDSDQPKSEQGSNDTLSVFVYPSTTKVNDCYCQTKHATLLKAKDSPLFVLHQIHLSIINTMCLYACQMGYLRTTCKQEWTNVNLQLSQRSLALLSNQTEIQKNFRMFECILETFYFLSFHLKQFELFDDLLSTSLLQFLVLFRVLIACKRCYKMQKNKQTKDLSLYI
ncbi:hypothetical protein RFI_01467 [Reticulomyxa filosa]|uniref:Uncharacterized protein n=1 Tax=Reticulomyxa filosa TaxID=46433 RepID=X6PBN4_RETFI|nr:hypothetical protein RFI_01467 [Reticulomyxa filosa]|eukprot:ETO35596.1 hypothetical protein RFI_01467 [Reticulomyxa filosa]